MRVAGIQRDSITNGIGVRDVIFLQGCPHGCDGCHNRETWNLLGGTEYETIFDQMKLADTLEDSSNHITISGGEPLIQWDELKFVLYYIKVFQQKNFWVYTGYTYEQIPPEMFREMVTAGVQVLVDGKFEMYNRDPELRFRGSSNQRLIDVPKTYETGEIVLWEG